MSQLNADTIVAISTAQGRGAIGVIRISGILSKTIAVEILGKVPESKVANYSNFLDINGSILDKGIAIFFPTPHSYTGEDILELQGHGGIAIQKILIDRCLTLGARLAEPGEFTLRAFLNNKLDLVQAEGIADLIEANTTEAARSSIRSLTGEFSLQIRSLLNDLINLRVLVESILDFPEEDLDQINTQHLLFLLNNLQQCLQRVLDQSKQGSLLREGAHIAIAGQTNVGKSSLLNRIAGDDIALVSDIHGTTRDVIKQDIQIKGVTLHFFDTAGLRNTDDPIELMGIQRAKQMISKSDLVLLIIDASLGLMINDVDILQNIPDGIPRLIVHNKSDLISLEQSKSSDDNHVFVSAKTGAGVDHLLNVILKLVGWRDLESGCFMARERHLIALEQARKHFENASNVICNIEFFAEELRSSQQALNQITGEYTSDDLLGEIFIKFCIGK